MMGRTVTGKAFSLVGVMPVVEPVMILVMVLVISLLVTLIFGLFGSAAQVETEHCEGWKTVRSRLWDAVN
jgi:hypothetical protein